MICPKCKGSRMVFKRIENTVVLGRCPMCDGLGEIKGTNFQRITESPEALAEFLGTWFVLPCKLCGHFRYDKCTAKISERRCDDAEAFEKWLKEESEE